MSRAALEVIYRSPICPDSLKDEIMEDLYNCKLLKPGEKLSESLSYYPAICNADLKKFAKPLENHDYAKFFKVDAIKKVVKNDTPGLMREKADGKIEYLPDQSKVLEMK